jgi:hypothetical protein
MPNLNAQTREHLLDLLHALIDEKRARVLVPPYRNAPGFWFGGGNLVQDGSGAIWMSGRYRNYGDSRTGLAAGERGLECALFRSDDAGQTFHKVRSWSKADLSRNHKVLSIEGTALHLLPGGNWELFISSEKALAYPPPLQAHQKKGTGIWTIERMTLPSGRSGGPEELDPATLAPVLDALDHPAYLHVKDPVVYDGPDGETVMVFCSHPYSWTSTNSGLAVRERGADAFAVQNWEMVPRGPTWDIAVTRITDRLPLPRVGCLAGLPPCAVYFYDGAECIHDHGQGSGASRRPRGYSCEEIGGAFLSWDDEGWPRYGALERLSDLAPLFTSPWGTGCSRYVSSLVTQAGILVTWEKGQEDGSQPLVGHFLPQEKVTSILSGQEQHKEWRTQ